HRLRLSSPTRRSSDLPSAQVKRRTKFLWIVIITVPVWALGQIRITPPSPQPPMEAVAGSPENVDVPQPDLRGLEAIITPPRAPKIGRASCREGVQLAG